MAVGCWLHIKIVLNHPRGLQSVYSPTTYNLVPSLLLLLRLVRPPPTCDSLSQRKLVPLGTDTIGSPKKSSEIPSGV